MTDAYTTAAALLSLQAEVDRMRRVCVDAYWQGMKAGRDMERSAVVTYLLAPGTSCDNYALAEAIELGEHRREEKP